MATPLAAIPGTPSLIDVYVNVNFVDTQQKLKFESEQQFNRRCE